MARDVAAGQELVDRAPMHGPFAGWALDEAIGRIVAKATNEASSAALTSAIVSGHLVPYLPNKHGSFLQPLDKGTSTDIIDEYFNQEKHNRRLGSPESDVLEEFCSGMKIYFEKSWQTLISY